MYELSYSKQFGKDVRLALKRGYSIDLLQSVVERLHETGKLDPIYRTHKLQGSYSHCLECHIRPDGLLIWQQDEVANKLS